MPLQPEAEFARVINHDDHMRVLASHRQYDHRAVLSADQCEPDYLADCFRQAAHILLHDAAERGEALDWATARWRLDGPRPEVAEVNLPGAIIATLSVDVLS